jgi:hypothetical protein
VPPCCTYLKLGSHKAQKRKTDSLSLYKLTSRNILMYLGKEIKEQIEAIFSIGEAENG